jgi:GTP-binding protein
MKNPFKNTAFLFGVTKHKNLPKDAGIEILLSGRSNAGKSSALNALTGNKKLARISKTPGRTTEINFLKLKKILNFLTCLVMVLLSQAILEKKTGAHCLENTLKIGKLLKQVLIFMDIRHPLKPIDLEMIELCESFSCGLCSCSNQIG